MYNCSKCAFSNADVNVLIVHLKSAHCLSTNSTFTCMQNTCPQKFTNLSSFKRHLTKQHPANCNADSENSQPIYTSTSDTSSAANKKSQPPVIEHTSGSDTSSISIAQFKNDREKSALAFLCKLHSNSSLSRHIVLEIASEISEEFKKTCDALKQIILPKISDDDSDEISDILSFCSTPFDKINTEYLLLKELESRNLYEGPIQYTINNEVSVITSSNNPTFDEKETKGVLMPLKFQFKKIFELPMVFDKTVQRMNDLKENSKISNFYNGKLMQNKLLNFSTTDIVIPFFLYIDSFEINNPLGSHRGVQAITGVYYSFPTMPTEFLSSLGNIFVAMIFKSDDNKRFGNELCLNQLIQTVKEMAVSGIEICVNGRNIKVFFVLGLLLGDNLGLNSALGFTKSFSSNYYCRFCKEHRKILRKKCSADNNVLRSKENYSIDIITNDLSATGITEESIFNEIPFFHVVENYSVDVMHDLFEGVFHYNMCRIILYFVDETRSFTLDILNGRKQSFQYGESEIGNISPNITMDHLKKDKLNMSAREMQCFVHHFSLMIGDLVPRNNAVWDLFILLVKFFDLSFMDEMNADHIRLLKLTAEELNGAYIRLFNVNLKPKHHFLLHYSNIVEQSGPLKFLNCIRFEAKHREFKKYTNNITSRRNTPLSIAIKSQMKFAYKIMVQKGFQDEIFYSRMQLLTQHEISDFGLKENTEYFHASVVVYKGTNFKINFHFTLSYPSIKLYKILNIVVDKNENVFLICQEYTICGYDNHYQSYEVGPAIEKVLNVSITELKTPPIHTHIVNSKIYFRYKNY